MPESPAPASTDELLELTDVIRRVVRGRVSRPEDVEDLVQETLVRVAEAQNRLDAETLASYAAVTARNLVVTKYRSDGRQRRHIHRLVEYNCIGDPEELALRREQNDALAVALARVPERDREILLFHEVDGIDTATLAAHTDSTPGGIAMRLARPEPSCASSSCSRCEASNSRTSGAARCSSRSRLATRSGRRTR